MTLKLRLLSILMALTPWLPDLAGAAPVTIGVVLPAGQSLQSPDAAETLRQSLLSQLKARAVETVSLSATANEAADREAASKHCNFVLYTHLQPARSSSGVSGTFSKMKAILSGPSAFGVQPTDSLTLQYRLIAVGASNPVNAESFSEKAAADGQVPATLVAQMSSAVVTAAQGNTSGSGAAGPRGAAGASAAPAASEPAGSSAPPAAAGNPPSSGRSSPFAGLFGRNNASRSIAPGGGSSMNNNNMNNTNMNCAQLAAVPNALISADACEKFKSSQQTYSNAAADPNAARAGDEQMSCTQITAELKQQQFSAPDKTKVASAQATAADTQAILKKEHENMLKMQARDQAATAAASATDTATELATGGLVRGRALQATEKVLEEEHRANNERVAREDNPTFSKLNAQTADLSTDFAAQLQANPRLARLMQLADSKHCKGGG